MLYITTRCAREPVTAAWPLKTDRGAEGGLFVPFRGPDLTPEQWQGKSINALIAQILNRFFRTELTAWELDCAIGRNPIRLKALSQRILMGELWHNPAGEYRFLEDRLLKLLGAGDGWPRMAIRVAVLTALAQLAGGQGAVEADISMLTGNFSWPMAAWYARSWGAGLGNILCTCNENRGLWELMTHGQLRTDAVAEQTGIPQADVAVPEELERLIFAQGGEREVARFLEARLRGGSYAPGELLLSQLRQGIRVSVVSAGRVDTTIPSVYRTHRYEMSPATALAYGGLLDDRSKTGQIGPGIVLALEKP